MDNKNEITDLPSECLMCGNIISETEFADNQFYSVFEGYNSPKGFLCINCIKNIGENTSMEEGNKVEKYEIDPPVQVGEELEVEIESVGEKGDGLAKKNGFVLFVPTAKQGDKVRVRVTRVLRKVGFAEVVA